MTEADRSSVRWFHIVVDGRLSAGFAAGLEGVEQHDTGDGTILHGRYVDDSHLHGLLDQLTGMAIGIRRFEIDPAPGEAPATEEV